MHESCTSRVAMSPRRQRPTSSGIQDTTQDHTGDHTGDHRCGWRRRTGARKPPPTDVLLPACSPIVVHIHCPLAIAVCACVRARVRV